MSRGAKDNQAIDGDMTTQVNTIFANAKEIAEGRRLRDVEHVVANRVYITDGAAFGEMNKAYVPNFPKDPPARATVIVGLPGPDLQGRDHDDRASRARRRPSPLRPRTARQASPARH